MPTRHKPPTSVEREVLRALIEHGNVPRAAVALHKSESTTNTHLDRMRARYRVGTTVQLVALAVRCQWDMPEA